MPRVKAPFNMFMRRSPFTMRKRVLSGGGGGGGTQRLFKLDSLPDVTVTQGAGVQTFNTGLTSSSFAGSTPLYSLVSPPTGFSINVATGVISADGATVTTGAKTIVRQVDGYGGSQIRQAFTAAVRAAKVFPNQIAIFGALDPASTNGVKPLTSHGEEIDLTGSPTLISGSLGAFTAAIVSGRLQFTGGTGAPNGAVLRCTGNTAPYVGQTVDITIQTDANTRGAANLTELLNILSLSAATKSGLIVPLRPGSYATTNAAVGGKFENLSSSIIIKAANANNKATLAQCAIFNGTNTGLTQGNVTFEDIRFFNSSGTASRITGNVTTSNTFVEITSNANPVANITLRRCVFQSDVPNPRFNNLIRPNNRSTAVDIQNGTNILIEDCTFDSMVNGVNIGADNTTVQRCTFTGFFDDPLRIVPRSGNTVVSNVSVLYNRFYDWKPDGGYHPDMIHWFPNGGTGIDGVLFEGNMFFASRNGALQPSMPVNKAGGAYVPNATLVTADKTLVEADGGAMYFIDAAANAVTITLPDPASFSVDRDTLFQVVNTAAFPVTLSCPVGTMLDLWTGATFTSLTFPTPCATFQVWRQGASNRWVIDRTGADYQGVFSNTFTAHILNATIAMNLMGMNANSIRVASTGSANGLVANNTCLPMWPWDLFNNGDTASPYQYWGKGGSRFIQFDGGAANNNIAAGNICSVVTTATQTIPDAVNNILAAEVDLNNSWSALQTLTQVNDPLVQQHFPFTPLEVVDCNRPPSTLPIALYGFGAGLAPYGQEALDWMNFGQFPLEPWGPRTNKPWFVRRLFQTVIPGGAYLTWLAPAYLKNGAITDYPVSYRINGGALTPLSGVGTNTSALLENRAIGETVQLQVGSTNANGTFCSISLPSFTVTEAAAALQPTIGAVLLDQHITGSGTNQYTTASFTPATSDPIFIRVPMRTTPTTQLVVNEATFGAAGRAFGTGTPLTFVGQCNNTLIQCMGFWFTPVAGQTYTLKFIFSGNGNGVRFRATPIIGGHKTALIGALSALNRTGNSTSVTASVTTTRSKSLTYAWTATGVDAVQSSPTDTVINDATISVGHTAEASKGTLTIGTLYTSTFTWTGSALNCMMMCELVPQT